MRLFLQIPVIVTRGLTALAFSVCLAAACAQDSAAPPWIKDPGVKVYREKYLAGASHKAFAIAESGQLALTREWPLVIYCADWQCWEAYNAMQRLYSLGYHKLYWYRGGLASWTKAELPVVEAPLSAQVMQLK